MIVFFWFINLFFIVDSSNLASTIQFENINYQIGEDLFNQNCAVCHHQGTNIIIPEKNLKKETLVANGMNSIDAIFYQVTNGKNGMPAFGDRLYPNEIINISKYILIQTENNFEK
jgi:cytochrome c6